MVSVHRTKADIQAEVFGPKGGDFPPQVVYGSAGDFTKALPGLRRCPEDAPTSTFILTRLAASSSALRVFYGVFGMCFGGHSCGHLHAHGRRPAAGFPTFGFIFKKFPALFALGKPTHKPGAGKDPRIRYTSHDTLAGSLSFGEHEGMEQPASPRVEM